MAAPNPFLAAQNAASKTVTFGGLSALGGTGNTTKPGANPAQGFTGGFAVPGTIGGMGIAANLPGNPGKVVGSTNAAPTPVGAPDLNSTGLPQKIKACVPEAAYSEFREHVIDKTHQ
jgi:hypothetical protein